MRLVAWERAEEAPRDLEDRFPGRWDPKRALDRPLRPLVAAVDALLAGREVHERCALILGVDDHHQPAAVRFAQALQAGRRLSPATFLGSLPSTPATTLSLLFQLKGYQATLDTRAQAGLQALAHAADLLALGRCEQVVVAALSRAGQGALGVAALLDAREGLTLEQARGRADTEPLSGSAAERLLAWLERHGESQWLGDAELALRVAN